MDSFGARAKLGIQPAAIGVVLGQICVDVAYFRLKLRAAGQGFGVAADCPIVLLVSIYGAVLC